MQNLKVGEINITNKAIGSKNTLNSIFEKIQPAKPKVLGMVGLITSHSYF